MVQRSLLRTMMFVLAIVVACASGVPALAGGPPSFSFEAPSGSAPRTASSPVLIVHAYSCHMPTDATVAAFAEGLVGGARRSLPIKLEPTGQKGVYAIARQWPAEGSWVLTFSVDQGGQTTALVTLDGRGEPVFDASSGASGRELSAKHVRTVSGRAKGTDIQAALAIAAAR